MKITYYFGTSGNKDEMVQIFKQLGIVPSDYASHQKIAFCPPASQYLYLYEQDGPVDPCFVDVLQRLIVRVVIEDRIPLEQNSHIKQAMGKTGKCDFQVSYNSEAFEVATHATGYASPKGFRAVVDIIVDAPNRDSAMACYNKIRQGDSGGHPWKGTAADIHVSGIISETDEF